ncbi:hypothetical protein C482_09168 [Natrialba chahannaoensis JCM 10990]|uniref:Uncharacterized protein n=1 Tax=Natrialba chahannaoensis JCM 10990 TaxID=1227492 RepID=M0ANL7_9EURY|nr:hypothetical protein [Natrialba chahannaoensis]ELY99926.1 hypothetical protein C482_09168 [Natrialba chahannaoensis JCM 10990]
MSLPEPTDVIVPHEDASYSTFDFLTQVMEGAYPHGVALEYQDLVLISQVDAAQTTNIWHVRAEDGSIIESLNLDAFRTATVLEETLDKTVAYVPSDRKEWVNSL